MKIYSRTTSSKGRRTIDQVIGKDIWFKCFYRNDMYWYKIIDVTDTDYIGYSTSDSRIWRVQYKCDAGMRKRAYNNTMHENTEKFPIRNFKKRFNEALQSPYADMCTTAELFGVSEDDVKRYSTSDIQTFDNYVGKDLWVKIELWDNDYDDYCKYYAKFDYVDHNDYLDYCVCLLNADDVEDRHLSQTAFENTRPSWRRSSDLHIINPLEVLSGDEMRDIAEDYEV